MDLIYKMFWRWDCIFYLFNLSQCNAKEGKRMGAAAAHASCAEEQYLTDLQIGLWLCPVTPKVRRKIRSGVPFRPEVSS